MPRIYTSRSDPMDFCRVHFPAEEEAFDRYGYLGDGPDGRGNCFGYDDDHPAYEDEDYDCAICGKRLREEDN